MSLKPFIRDNSLLFAIKCHWVWIKPYNTELPIPSCLNINTHLKSTSASMTKRDKASGLLCFHCKRKRVYNPSASSSEKGQQGMFWVLGRQFTHPGGITMDFENDRVSRGNTSTYPIMGKTWVWVIALGWLTNNTLVDFGSRFTLFLAVRTSLHI